jgi:hypothetical protein
VYPDLNFAHKHTSIRFFPFDGTLERDLSESLHVQFRTKVERKFIRIRVRDRDISSQHFCDINGELVKDETSYV